MAHSQGTSFILSSGSCVSRRSYSKERRHLRFCGEVVTVHHSSAVSNHDRRYVTCEKIPKCNFFEWIDDFDWIEVDDGAKKGWPKEKKRRVHCFCGDTLSLQISGTTKNPNRRFISCPNKRCKFFEWVDEVGARSNVSAAAAVGVVGTQNSAKLEAEMLKLDAQERKIERLNVEIERLIVEAKEIDACVGRLCDELNILEEQVGRLDDNMKIQYKRMKMPSLPSLCFPTVFIQSFFLLSMASLCKGFTVVSGYLPSSQWKCSTHPVTARLSICRFSIRPE
ncbi:uncharacterized protein DS421_9g259020 [Arachis hypogaea]|nr:uncharacterized protein DS421_9g259020 [Arachis hypogaea]